MKQLFSFLLKFGVIITVRKKRQCLSVPTFEYDFFFEFRTKFYRLNANDDCLILILYHMEFGESRKCHMHTLYA